MNDLFLSSVHCFVVGYLCLYYASLGRLLEHLQKCLKLINGRTQC
uniref:Uncharacterized protein n=1 Tax=Rhizophora mucronata TaxID=61149 RepID=A0A2P2QSP3_RHIMU